MRKMQDFLSWVAENGEKNRKEGGPLLAWLVERVRQILSGHSDGLEELDRW